jgi:hypothetical protein
MWRFWKSSRFIAKAVRSNVPSCTPVLSGRNSEAPFWYFDPLKFEVEGAVCAAKFNLVVQQEHCFQSSHTSTRCIDEPVHIRSVSVKEPIA